MISLLTFVVCVIVTVAVFSFAASTFKWTEVNATVVEKVYIPPNTVYEAVGRGVDGQLVVTLQKVIREPAWVLVAVDENSVTWNVHVNRYEWERTKILDDIKVRQVDNGN